MTTLPEELYSLRPPQRRRWGSGRGATLGPQRGTAATKTHRRDGARESHDGARPRGSGESPLARGGTPDFSAGARAAVAHDCELPGGLLHCRQTRCRHAKGSSGYGKPLWFGEALECLHARQVGASGERVDSGLRRLRRLLGCDLARWWQRQQLATAEWRDLLRGGAARPRPRRPRLRLLPAPAACAAHRSTSIHEAHTHMRWMGPARRALLPSASPTEALGERPRRNPRTATGHGGDEDPRPRRRARVARRRAAARRWRVPSSPGWRLAATPAPIPHCGLVPGAGAASRRHAMGSIQAS